MDNKENTAKQAYIIPQNHGKNFRVVINVQQCGSFLIMGEKNVGETGKTTSYYIGVISVKGGRIMNDKALLF